MPRLMLKLCVLVFVIGAFAAPAAAQTGPVLARAGAELRRDPVYVDPQAERTITGDEANKLRAKIRSSGTPMFVALLPNAASDEAAGLSALPEAVSKATGLDGTFAVVTGTGFRAGSNTLSQGTAGRLATTAIQSQRANGTYAVLAKFVDDVASDSGASSGSNGGSGGDGGRQPTTKTKSGFGGGTLLLLIGLIAFGVFAISRHRKRRRAEQAAHQEDARAYEADRQMLQAQVSVLADDVLGLEPQVTIHPEARVDYDAAVNRYRAAQAALEYADEAVDLQRVDRVVVEARYSMDRARAHIDGRELPPPPEELMQPGQRGEPPVVLDDQRQPVYVGYDQPFHTGWFGGGGGTGLFTGLLLGHMLGGMGGFGGWGGGFGGWGGGGWGGGYGDRDNDFEGGDSGGGWGGGGDWGGGGWGGGGDWGGGGWGGGGDWGGGGGGGGDWGGGGGGGDW